MSLISPCHWHWNSPNFIHFIHSFNVSSLCECMCINIWWTTMLHINQSRQWKNTNKQTDTATMEETLCANKGLHWNVIVKVTALRILWLDLLLRMLLLMWPDVWRAIKIKCHTLEIHWTNILLVCAFKSFHNLWLILQLLYLHLHNKE